MAGNDDFTIPEEVLDVWRRTIDQADVDAIQAYVANDKHIADGFRTKNLTGGALRAVKDKIKARLPREFPIDGDICDLLVVAGFSLKFTTVLSSDVIEYCSDELFGLFGWEFVASLLVDERERVRSIGFEAILEGGMEERPDSETALTTLRDNLATFLDITRPWYSESAPRAHKGDDEKTGELLQRVSELEAELLSARKRYEKEQKQIQKKTARLVSKNTERDKLLRKEKEQRENEAERHKEARRQLRALSNEKDKIEAEQEARIEQRVGQELQSLRNRWLKRLESIERMANDCRKAEDAGDVLTRVAAALEKQAERDRQFGNIVAIKERLERLENAGASIRQARSEALKPASGLDALERDVRREIERLKDVLGESEPSRDRLLSVLLSGMQSARCIDDLMKRKRLVDDLNDVGALSRDQLTALCRAYHDHMQLVYNAFTPAVAKSAFGRDDASWLLCRVLEDGNKGILVLDGHNVLYGLEDRFHDVYEDGQPRGKARRKLAEILDGLCGMSPGLEVELFFDGPRRSFQTHSERFKIVYSGGAEGEEHRADAAILKTLEYYCRERSAMSRILVTDDRDLEREAGKLGAHKLSVAQFDALLDMFSRERTCPPSRSTSFESTA